MDKYDVLMNLKRQGTETNTNTGTTTRPPATSAVATPSASPISTPGSTSRAPTSTAVLTPTSSSASPTSAAPTTSSTPVTSQTSATPTPSSTSATPSSSAVVSTSSVVSSTPVTSSSQAVSSSAVVSSITPSASSIRTSSTISRNVITVPPGSYTLVPTTSGGQVFTVTQVVANPSGSAGAATKKPFFKNTGAVVGVFVVVGIAATALAVLIITMFIRRRRAKRFDRDVQEAAREAAQTQPPMDDDDYTHGSYNTHASATQPMSTERPSGYGSSAGYGSGASSWDPYGRATGGYEMQHRRTSTGTAPGMAGFGAGDAFARNVGVDQPQTYNQPQAYGQQAYGQQAYGQQQGYGDRGYNDRAQAQAGYQTYNNTSPPQNYALAQPAGQTPGRAPVQATMMIPEAQRQSQNYNTVSAYRSSPSYGEAHPGEHVEYGHTYGGEDQPRQAQGGYVPAPRASPGTPAATRMSEDDPYGGYEVYDNGRGGAGASASQAHSAGPPAYVSGAGSVAATGDRKGGAGVASQGQGSGSGQGASVGRQHSGKSAMTRYSQDMEEDSDGSAYDQPPRRVLKVANE